MNRVVVLLAMHVAPSLVACGQPDGAPGPGDGTQAGTGGGAQSGGSGGGGASGGSGTGGLASTGGVVGTGGLPATGGEVAAADGGASGSGGLPGSGGLVPPGGATGAGGSGGAPTGAGGGSWMYSDADIMARLDHYYALCDELCVLIEGCRPEWYRDSFACLGEVGDCAGWPLRRITATKDELLACLDASNLLFECLVAQSCSGFLEWYWQETSPYACQAEEEVEVPACAHVEDP